MPVGPITPGQLVSITADVIGSLPPSYNITPSNTMDVDAAQMQSAMLSMANADKFLDTVKGNRSGDTFVNPTFTGLVTINGARKIMFRARSLLTDANFTRGVGNGDRFTLPAVTSAKRTITLQSTGTVPNAGETLTFLCYPVGLTQDGSGIAFEFQLEDTSVAARVYLPQNGGPLDQFWLTFEFTGGAWALCENSGTACDLDLSGPDPALAYYGVKLS